MPVSEIGITSQFDHFRIIAEHTHTQSPISENHQRRISGPRLAPSPSQQSVCGQTVGLSQVFHHAFEPFPPSASALLPLGLFPSEHLTCIEQTKLERHPVARPMRRHRDGSIINHFIQPCAHAVFTNHIAASGQEFGIIAYLEPIQYDHIHVEVHRP